jgi:hypothetical protein
MLGILAGIQDLLFLKGGFFSLCLSRGYIPVLLYYQYFYYKNLTYPWPRRKP